MKTMSNIILFALTVLYCLSWTNLLHPVYNWWGLIVWSGKMFDPLVTG